MVSSASSRIYWGPLRSVKARRARPAPRDERRPPAQRFSGSSGDGIEYHPAPSATESTMTVRIFCTPSTSKKMSHAAFSRPAGAYIQRATAWALSGWIPSQICPACFQWFQCTCEHRRSSRLRCIVRLLTQAASRIPRSTCKSCIVLHCRDGTRCNVRRFHIAVHSQRHKSRSRRSARGRKNRRRIRHVSCTVVSAPSWTRRDQDSHS
jgi:hypothetical protein